MNRGLILFLQFLGEPIPASNLLSNAINIAGVTRTSAGVASPDDSLIFNVCLKVFERTDSGVDGCLIKRIDGIGFVKTAGSKPRFIVRREPVNNLFLLVGNRTGYGYKIGIVATIGEFEFSVRLVAVNFALNVSKILICGEKIRAATVLSWRHINAVYLRLVGLFELLHLRFCCTALL